MSSREEEYIQADKNVNIASYAATVPNLILWIWVFFRIMRQKERAKFFSLTVICVLMILSMIFGIVAYQLAYT